MSCDSLKMLLQGWIAFLSARSSESAEFPQISEDGSPQSDILGYILLTTRRL
jgi:hypothetical protein